LKYEFQKLVDPPNEAELKLAVPENLDPVQSASFRKEASRKLAHSSLKLAETKLAGQQNRALPKLAMAKKLASWNFASFKNAASLKDAYLRKLAPSNLAPPSNVAHLKLASWRKVEPLRSRGSRNIELTKLIRPRKSEFLISMREARTWARVDISPDLSL